MPDIGTFFVFAIPFLREVLELHRWRGGDPAEAWRACNWACILVRLAANRGSLMVYGAEPPPCLKKQVCSIFLRAGFDNLRACLQARRLWNSAVKSAPATLSGDSEQHKKIDVQIKPAEGDRQSRRKELGARGEWGKSCTHVTYSSCVFMSWTHVLHSWPTLVLCTPVVCSWSALMLCTHVVYSCCVFMACLHVVLYPSFALVLCTHVVCSWHALMLCTHVVYSMTCPHVIAFTACPHLREFVLTPVILAIAPGKGGSEQRAFTPLRRDPQESPGEFQIVQIRVFTAKVTRLTLQCILFLLFHTPVI